MKCVEREFLSFRHVKTRESTEASKEYRSTGKLPFRFIRRMNLIYTSLAALLAVGVILVVFGYLKTDDATDGRYRRPLRVVAGLSLVGLVAAGVALTTFAVVQESQFGGFLSSL